MEQAIFRSYTSQWGITGDYRRVRDFLIRRGCCEFTYARWDWMTTHPCLDRENVGKIGLWERNGQVVAAALFDCQLGDAFFITLPGEEGLREEMLSYGEKNLIQPGHGVLVPDWDRDFQRFMAKAGYCATPQGESDAAFFLRETPLDYRLPDGFSITDMKERYDIWQYGRVLWKGFDHERNGEGLFEEQTLPEDPDSEMLRENVALFLKVAAVAPDGNFAGYCGMWYDPAAGYAVVEPVAVDPQYRRMGLGRAVVLEGLGRVKAMGAKIALVGSSQPFYYRIGFRPYQRASLWVKK